MSFRTHHLRGQRNALEYAGFAGGIGAYQDREARREVDIDFAQGLEAAKADLGDHGVGQDNPSGRAVAMGLLEVKGAVGLPPVVRYGVGAPSFLVRRRVR